MGYLQNTGYEAAGPWFLASMGRMQKKEEKGRGITCIARELLSEKGVNVSVWLASGSVHEWGRDGGDREEGCIRSTETASAAQNEEKRREVEAVWGERTDFKPAGEKVRQAHELGEWKEGGEPS